ncbi:MAG: peptidylprolyl isomerase [Pseudonocardiales bacterium]|jgi:peptidylprolyl isomerase|nr:peptidylprolyl isomerase FKBP-type [Frankiales bacterium]MDQ1734206.1 peptidylprolyl isomerase [Pseudonocardiales bacterium]
MRRVLIPVLCTAAIAVAGCGASSKHTASPASSAPATSSGTAGTVATAGPFPAATGGYGDKPALSFTGAPSAALQRKTIAEGSGKPVVKGDLLAVNYLGQIWGGKVFDNSYDRHQSVTFPIGTGQVIPGWDAALVGVKAGSRVLLSIPPAQGYGTAGQSQAGIKGTDTLVFVVDIIASYDKNVTADPNAVPQTPPANAPKVSGALAHRPTIQIPKGLAVPKKPTAFLLAKGSGAPVHNGNLVVQYEVQTWDGKPAASTWTGTAPGSITIGATSGTSVGLFTGLVGKPLGSRVLLELPASTGQSGTIASSAVVMDLIAQPGVK